jgi:selenocysteine-specific elongation factor
VSGLRLTLGTAGHIDHGKTWLVQALTGKDTDRLTEEKRRGISIVLGYARLDLPGGSQLSVVDVPGHERFVRTMVAGATGIDLFLLVVDAGEGPKPQTHEHLEILRLLRVEHGVVALTKVDAVQPARIDATEAAVHTLLPRHEIVRVSAVQRTGLDDLVAALARAAAAVGPRGHDGPARLYVDRSFSLPGPGLVVTGTLRSGTVDAGERLQVLPAGYELRVRSIEVHDKRVDRAAAGQRAALAVSADRRRRPQPGDAIVEPGAFALSYRLDIELDGSAPGGGDVTVCHGTSAVAARLFRVGARFAQLRLSSPLVAARGDQIVLRRATTVGGGRVLDPAPPRNLDERRFELLTRDDPASLLAALVDGPVAASAVRMRLGRAVAGVEGFVESHAWICSEAWLDATRFRARAALETRAADLDPGLPPSALLGDKPWTSAIAGLLGLESEGGRLYLPGRRATAAGHDDGIDARLAQSGLEPIVLDTALARQLEQEGRVVRLGDGFAIGPNAYRQFEQVLLREYEAGGTVTLAGFRDRAGVSRRVAQLVLERFDADRITLRVGDERRLRRRAAR